MSGIRILIVEDELIIAEDMSSKLEQLGYDVVGIAINYDQAIELLEEEKPDLALLDIMIEGDRDGIEIGKTISASYFIPFIFITSHADKRTVAQAKMVKPSGYLMKPFEKDDLFTAIEIALTNFNQSSIVSQERKIKDCLFIKENNLYLKVKFSDILWMKAEGNYTMIYTSQRRHMVRKIIKEILDQLPDSIMRLHKSYAVNIEKIDAINSTFVLVKEEEIPLGKVYREEIMKGINSL